MLHARIKVKPKKRHMIQTNFFLTSAPLPATGEGVVDADGDRNQQHGGKHDPVVP